MWTLNVQAEATTKVKENIHARSAAYAHAYINFIVKSVGCEFAPALICISFKSGRALMLVLQNQNKLHSQRRHNMKITRSKSCVWVFAHCQARTMHYAPHGALREHNARFNCVKFTSSNIKEWISPAYSREELSSAHSATAWCSFRPNRDKQHFPYIRAATYCT
jgi:hypothetical protein